MNPVLTRDDLVKKLDLTGVPVNLQDQILAQLGENIISSVTLEVVSRLTTEDRKTFETLLKQDDSRGIENFLDKKVPGVDNLIKEKTIEEITLARKKNNQ